jgi:hypothetical protein
MSPIEIAVEVDQDAIPRLRILQRGKLATGERFGFDFAWGLLRLGRRGR